ncbi:very short patch repair endonuclease [Phyllobacterium sophorae]|uniref:Very short patch repair endonuclease n=1 Tax=Phyllobacterium sophorae TaxID=1520277 RepID=A0A2P7AQ22_9HYPH|nr:DNA mismatch endonuclease Vsr [Phyllobacterium sophorae]PSH56312.1 very short patch repair endonuclease [Phyllobacterium sophorae]
MVDIVDTATRSRMMAGIRGRDTRPELALRHALHALGLRYRLHGRNLPGKPDLVFPKRRAVVFVHGCFWHRHQGCRFATTPATRPEFWSKKFEDNLQRDRRILTTLQQSDWRIAVVWECAINAEGGAVVAEQIFTWLHSVERTINIPPDLSLRIS